MSAKGADSVMVKGSLGNQLKRLILLLYRDARPNAHRQHGSYKEDGVRSDGIWKPMTVLCMVSALQFAVHAFRTEEELKSHRASKEELDQNR
ncbi:hypothetical protein Tco_0982239, partial [Tanacetum coccineum]